MEDASPPPLWLLHKRDPPFHNLFFLKRVSAEERRSGYEDDDFGCGHGIVR